MYIYNAFYIKALSKVLPDDFACRYIQTFTVFINKYTYAFCFSLYNMFELEFEEENVFFTIKFSLIYKMPSLFALVMCPGPQPELRLFVLDEQRLIGNGGCSSDLQD